MYQERVVLILRQYFPTFIDLLIYEYSVYEQESRLNEILKLVNKEKYCVHCRSSTTIWDFYCLNTYISRNIEENSLLGLQINLLSKMIRHARRCNAVFYTLSYDNINIDNGINSLVLNFNIQKQLFTFDNTSRHTQIELINSVWGDCIHHFIYPYFNEYLDFPIRLLICEFLGYKM